MNSDPRDKRFCRNTWQFEGFLIEAPTIKPVESGMLVVVARLQSREHVKGEKTFPVKVPVCAFRDSAEALLEYKEGDRLIVSGNFYNPPRNSYNYWRVRYVVTASRQVSAAGTTSLNGWEFEGTVACEPRRLKIAGGKPENRLGAWQTSITMPKRAPGKVPPIRTRPVMLNTIVRGQIWNEVKDFCKGDSVFMSGRMITLSRTSQTCWPICERAALLDPAVADQRQLRKSTDVLVGDLDAFGI